MIKIVIVDDHEPDLNRIHACLSSCRDFEIVGIGREGYEALKIVAQQRPDIVILDISPEYIEGAEFASLLKRKSPSSSIILFTGKEHEEYIRKAIGSEVSGYLLKSTDMHRLAATIRRVHKGGHCISEKITRKAFRMFSSMMKSGPSQAHHPRREREDPFPLFPLLSATELKVMGFLARGWSDKEIAESLRLKTGTIRNCVSSAMRKAGLHNRTQVAIFALRNGLVV